MVSFLVCSSGSNTELFLLYSDVDQLSVKDLCHFKKITRSNTDEMDSRMRDTGNDSASTAPKSTEESLSEDVFTESELSPIREELVSSDELRQDKSSGASSESVQTVNQTGADHVAIISDSGNVGDVSCGVELPVNDDNKSVSDTIESKAVEKAQKEAQSTVGEIVADAQESQHGIDQGSVVENVTDSEECLHSEDKDSEREITNKEKLIREPTRDSETDVEELRKLWKSHTMQQTKQQRDHMHQDAHKEMKHKVATVDGTIEGKEIKANNSSSNSASVLDINTIIYILCSCMCWVGWKCLLQIGPSCWVPVN